MVARAARPSGFVWATRSSTSIPAPPRASRARKPTRRSCRQSATRDSLNSRRYSSPTARRGRVTTAQYCWCCRAWTLRARAGSSNTLSARRIRWAFGTLAFGVPTEEERKHHYLWRIRRALPPAGHIGVFDRSHYEDVLMVRVHNHGATRGLGQPLRRDQQVREEARRQRYDTRQGGDVRLARGAEEAAGRAAGRPDKYWKYNPEGHRRAAEVAGVSGGLSGDAGPDVDRLRAVVRGALRQAGGTAGWRSPSC